MQWQGCPFLVPTAPTKLSFSKADRHVAWDAFDHNAFDSWYLGGAWHSVFLVSAQYCCCYWPLSHTGSRD